MIQDIYPHVLANEYRSTASRKPNDPVFYVRGQCVAVRRSANRGLDLPTVGDDPALPAAGDGPALPAAGDGPALPDARLTYLFSLDGTSCWLAPNNGTANPPAGFELVSNRDLRMERRGTREQMYAIYTAVHLADWYARNRFCGACGSPLGHHGTLRALTCPTCKNTVFPRLNPAVIVCVCDPVRNKIVLTRYAAGRYHAIDALVAGFVEIGETFEDCVHREVREELGLEVTNVRYYKSQPWGVAGDILCGYWCDVVGDPTIHRDDSELGSAVWAGPDQIPGQPDDLSLTNEMMCLWRDEHRA